MYISLSLSFVPHTTLIEAIYLLSSKIHFAARPLWESASQIDYNSVFKVLFSAWCPFLEIFRFILFHSRTHTQSLLKLKTLISHFKNKPIMIKCFCGRILVICVNNGSLIRYLCSTFFKLSPFVKLQVDKDFCNMTFLFFQQLCFPTTSIPYPNWDSDWIL